MGYDSSGADSASVVASKSESNASKTRISKRHKANAKLVSVNQLSKTQIERMHTIHSRYYNNVDVDIFERDLMRKNHVILMLDAKTKVIVGFTTIAKIKFRDHKGRKSVGLFSGDTILEQAYWGNKSWQLVWIQYAIRVWVENLGRPLYWLLISKGYKTYLLLANNVEHYYPNPEGKNAEMEELVEMYCEQLFPGYYDKDTKVLNFGESYQSLRSGVADITSDMTNRNELIAFFEKVNPNWRQGTELPCIGLLDISCLGHWLGKPVRKVRNSTNHPVKSLLSSVSR